MNKQKDKIIEEQKFQDIMFFDCDCCWRGNHRDCNHGSHNEEECKCDLRERW